jgi:predicted HD phosphohydrolase
VFISAAELHSKFEVWTGLRAAEINPARPDYEMVPGGAFKGLRDGTKQQMEYMANSYTARVDRVIPVRLLKMLEAQRGDTLGQPVDLYEHNLQTASRAYRGGESEETVVVSLFHDLTETIVSKNHGGAIAQLLAPYISPAMQWMLEKHEVFQGKYYFHHFGGDPDTRDRWIDNEYYNLTARWCELYDQPSFDPAYPSLPLSFFKPMVSRVLSKPAYWWTAKGQYYS